MISGQKLKLIRVLKGKTLTQLSRNIGLSKGYVSQMENEKAPITSEVYHRWINYLYGHTLPGSGKEVIAEAEQAVEALDSELKNEVTR